MTSPSDATRDLPAWARPVADADRIVTCGCCGRDMTWGRFLEHGPECEGEER